MRRDGHLQVVLDPEEAYLTSHHCQFIGYAVKMIQAARFDELAMADEKPFDMLLDQIGLRLATH